MRTSKFKTDTAIACEFLFHQYQYCIWLLLTYTSINDHGIKKDSLKDLVRSFHEFLTSAHDDLTYTYQDLMENRISLDHFKAVLMDYHQNVLLCWVLIHYSTATIATPTTTDYAKFAEATTHINAKFKYISKLLEKAQAKRRIRSCKHLKTPVIDYLQMACDVIHSTAGVNPADLVFIKNNISDGSSSGTSRSGSDNCSVAGDMPKLSKQKILTFFKEHLLRKANLVISFYKDVSYKADEKILRKQFKANHEALVNGKNESDDNKTESQKLVVYTRKYKQGQVHKHGCGMIENFFSLFLWGIKNNTELKKWWS
ncbi:hypothetical protein H4219_005380 [Mycoemilia scoparia]|uniref:Uncharacterized protein n=1 Tax=Mycoemilia scoparia TaxID=417184 RepID=A0A9W7ZPF4_9FUNG|nr:hypothetical protein H4219_005380 [Mycoemilia scoparia]